MRLASNEPRSRRWTTVLTAASALARAPLRKLVRREPDGWRRTLGLGQRIAAPPGVRDRDSCQAYGRRMIA